MMKMAYQGRGTGSKIISECLAGLSMQNFRKVRLAIDKGNPQSEHFWTKNMFIKTGEEFLTDSSVLLPMERVL